MDAPRRSHRPAPSATEEQPSPALQAQPGPLGYSEAHPAAKAQPKVATAPACESTPNRPEPATPQVGEAAQYRPRLATPRVAEAAPNQPGPATPRVAEATPTQPGPATPRVAEATQDEHERAAQETGRAAQDRPRPGATRAVGASPGPIGRVSPERRGPAVLKAMRYTPSGLMKKAPPRAMNKALSRSTAKAPPGSIGRRSCGSAWAHHFESSWDFSSLSWAVKAAYRTFPGRIFGRLSSDRERTEFVGRRTTREWCTPVRPLITFEPYRMARSRISSKFVCRCSLGGAG